MKKKMNHINTLFASDFTNYHRFICVNLCNLWRIFPINFFTKKLSQIYVVFARKLSVRYENVKNEAFVVLKIMEFTWVNDCFQNKNNEIMAFSC